MRAWTFELLFFLPLLIFPFTGLDAIILNATTISLNSQLPIIFVYALLALGLNVVVGFSGLLLLGIAGFFGVGAYIAAILMVPGNPFQLGFLPAMACAIGGSALVGLLLGAPTVRLRGDYLALVTLGFGEVVRYVLRNLEYITNGTRGLNPIPPPPDWMTLPFTALANQIGVPGAGQLQFYFLNLLILAIVYFLLRNLEVSRLGRAWVALREDELALTCMGVSATRVKLSAFTLGAAIAGLAGGLYATRLGSTANPDAYDFNRSIIILCCIILGGLGSLRGALLGTFLLIGFDEVLTPAFSSAIGSLDLDLNIAGTQILRISSINDLRLMIFGLVLILMMRFRPEGILPSQRVKAEMHKGEEE